MPTDSINKLRINLSRWKCFAFRITTQVVIDDILAKNLSLDSKHRFKRFYEVYTRSGVSHSITLRFVRQERQPNRYAVRILYEAEEPEELVDWVTMEQTQLKPTEAFLQLCTLETTLLFRCDCSFAYRQGEKGVYFPLPIKIDGEIFDEVRALKFVKLEQDKILWENYVDLVENDIMTHRVRFAQESKCSLDLPLNLLRQAKEISQKT